MRDLPRFKYHPDAIGTQVLEASLEACDCCGLPCEYTYRGATYTTHQIDNLCPWCISSGEAFRRFDVSFVPNVGVADNAFVEPWCAVAPDIVHEVSHLTPGFAGYQEEHWWSHCNDAGQFIGYVGDLPPMVFEGIDAQHFVAEMKSLHELSAEDWAWFVSTPDKTHSITFYVFRCLHCGKIGGYGDRS